MGSNIFTSALSGMNASQYGIATTEHNIANASTPGFSRQQILQSSRPGFGSASGYVGQGVDVTGIKRIYDQFLTNQVRQEQTQASYLTAYHTAMKQIDNLIADPTAGASPALQDFFSAINGVSNAPESVPARQTMLSNAQYVVNRFQAIDQRLTDIANGLNGQITSSVQTINTYAQQIATLNGNIARAISTGQGQPNDLLDQRDQLVNQLNLEVKTSVQQQADGALNVFIGSGQSLVVGEQAMALQVSQSATDPTKVDISYISNNKTIPIQQSSLQAGNLGAYLAFRDQNLEPARNALGRVALGLAISINQQNQLGQDLNGALGGNIFNAAAPRVSNGAANTGTANIAATIANVAGLTTSDYQLSFDGTNYSMLRMSDNVVTNLGATLPKTIDGFTVNVASGTAAAGDRFLIRPTANGARDIAVVATDPAKIAAAAPIRTNAPTTNTGTGKISAGAVDATYAANAATINAGVTLSYASATNTLSGFPATLPVTVTNNGVTTTFAAGTPVTYTSGATVSFGGVSFTLTGAPANNDKFTIGPNTNAVGDNRNALLMAGMQTKNLMANGTTTFQGAYGQLVGDVGAKTNELSLTSQAQNSMVTQTVASQQAVAGVNLDEEAANLMRYQKAYQAAAKAMQIANTLFDTVLAIGR